jgi:hypothetical protein
MTPESPTPCGGGLHRLWAAMVCGVKRDETGVGSDQSSLGHEVRTSLFDNIYRGRRRRHNATR